MEAANPPKSRLKSPPDFILNLTRTHKWPPLWQFTSGSSYPYLAFDASTAVRFHFLEIMISMIYKVLCIYLIAANFLAIITFDIILNVAANFNHSKIIILPAIDNKLRCLIITPDMTHIHHSTLQAETDSKYDYSLSRWDRHL